MEVLLTGLNKEGKVVLKVFLTEGGLLEVQKGEGFLSISFNGTRCVEVGGEATLNGERVEGSCVELLRGKVKCLEKALQGFDACLKEEVVEQVRTLSEAVKLVVYVVPEDELIPFTGDQEIDSLAFKVVEEYKKKYSKKGLVT